MEEISSYLKKIKELEKKLEDNKEDIKKLSKSVEDLVANNDSY